MKETVLIFTRNGYSALLDDSKQLFSELSDKEIIYALSVRAKSHPPSGSYKELHVMEMIDNDEYIKEWLVELGSKHRINAVIAMDEQCIYPASLARAYFKLPGIQPDTAEMVRNKNTMKNWARKSSVRCPDFITTKDPNIVRDFLGKYSRIVCKPLDGMGSKETSIIDSNEQLERVISLLIDENRLHLFIFEEFIPADIYHLDGLYSENQLVFSSLGSYEEPPIYFAKSIGQTTNLMHKGELYEKANVALCDIMKAFGLKNGVFHFEFFYYQNSVVFCEIGLRPAGGGIVEAIKHQSGMDLNREMVRVSLGLKPSTPSQGYEYAKVVSLFSHDIGKITSISSVQDFDSSVYPYVKINRILGEINNPPRHNTDFVATFAMVDNDVKKLDRKAAEVYQQFICLVDTEESKKRELCNV
ncbi:acetyl-CoA carboxylase biotin carboxylase subunit family protein [Vibrio fluvialis]